MFFFTKAEYGCMLRQHDNQTRVGSPGPAALGADIKSSSISSIRSSSPQSGLSLHTRLFYFVLFHQFLQGITCSRDQMDISIYVVSPGGSRFLTWWQTHRFCVHVQSAYRSSEAGLIESIRETQVYPNSATY